MKEGDKIPAFKLQNQRGEWIDSKDLIGKKNLVLYFYPEDNTPGCSLEARSFQEELGSFEEYDTVVFGISHNDTESHKSFAAKCSLGFDLLSDPDLEVHQKFGVTRQLLGLVRARKTFVVDKAGTVRAIYDSAFLMRKHVTASLKTLQHLA